MDIAGQIETIIQFVVDSFADTEGINDNSEISTFVSEITTDITDLVLMNASAQRFEQLDTGGVWALVRCSTIDIKGAAETAFENHENTTFTGLDSTQAMNFFNAEFESNPPESDPVE